MDDLRKNLEEISNQIIRTNAQYIDIDFLNRAADIQNETDKDIIEECNEKIEKLDKYSVQLYGLSQSASAAGDYDLADEILAELYIINDQRDQMVAFKSFIASKFRPIFDQYVRYLMVLTGMD